MRRLLFPALLLLGAADKLPPPDDVAHLPKLTPAEQAGEELVRAYEEFCLNRFPSVDMLKKGIAGHHLQPAATADAAEALQGRDGKAWAITGDKGHYTLGITLAPHLGCVVTGIVEDGESIRTIFNIAVQGYAAVNDLGKMDFPPLLHREIGGRPVTLQLIGTLGDNRRQAFVNMALKREDGTTLARMAREFAPEKAK